MADPMEQLVKELAENDGKLDPPEKEKTVSFKEIAAEKKARRDAAKDDAAVLRLEKIVHEEHAKEAKAVGKAAEKLGTAAEKLASKKDEIEDTPENRAMYRGMVLAMQEKLKVTPVRQRFNTAADYKAELDCYKNELSMRRANQAFASAVPKVLETVENVNRKFAPILVPMGINTFSPVSLKETFETARKKDPLLEEALIECSILYSPWFKTSPTMAVALSVFSITQDVMLQNATGIQAPKANEVDANLYPDL